MSNADDPRMRGFKRRAEVADVLRLLEERVKPLEPRRVPSFNAHGRVLAERVTSPVAVPGFDRAAMDGFAVRGEDTFGASELAPLALRLAGMSVPGSPALGSVGRGEAMPIMTGAPMPPGADAVLMAEDAQGAGDSVRATAAVPPGKNVSKRGEDIREGEVIFEPGRTLRPQDLGMLAACGIAHVRVRAWPSVTVFATGAELLAPGASPRGCCIVDSNTPMLASLVERDGGSVAEHGIRHDENQLRQSLQASTSDVILVSGGSSVGREDFVPSIVRELGELPVHGVAMRPSSPTGVGFIGGRPVFLLPGNPVSCLCAYDFFAGPTIRALGGRSRDWPYRRVDLPLARKITSEAGRVDYARVRVVDGKVEPLMVSGAGILSSTTRADGFVIVPRDAEGIPEDATVTVYLYG